jgi:hypothetical protein
MMNAYSEEVAKDVLEEASVGHHELRGGRVEGDALGQETEDRLVQQSATLSGLMVT